MRPTLGEEPGCPALGEEPGCPTLGEEPGCPTLGVGAVLLCISTCISSSPDHATSLTADVVALSSESPGAKAGDGAVLDLCRRRSVHICYYCTCVYMCAHVCTCVYMYVYVCTCVYMCVHVRICVHMCVHIRICVYMCVHLTWLLDLALVPPWGRGWLRMPWQQMVVLQPGAGTLKLYDGVQQKEKRQVEHSLIMQLAYEVAGFWRVAVEGSCMLWVWLFSSCIMIPAAARSLCWLGE